MDLKWAGRKPVKGRGMVDEQGSNLMGNGGMGMGEERGGREPRVGEGGGGHGGGRKVWGKGGGERKDDVASHVAMFLAM